MRGRERRKKGERGGKKRGSKTRGKGERKG